MENSFGTTRWNQSYAHQNALVVRTLLRGPQPFPLSAPFPQHARTRFRHSRQWLRVRMARAGAPARRGGGVTGADGAEGWWGYGCGWREQVRRRGGGGVRGAVGATGCAGEEVVGLGVRLARRGAPARVCRWLRVRMARAGAPARRGGGVAGADDASRCAGSQPTLPPHRLNNAKPLFRHTQREYPVYAQRELLDFPMRELLGTVYSLKLKQHHSRAEVAPCSTTRRDGAKPRSDES